MSEFEEFWYTYTSESVLNFFYLSLSIIRMAFTSDPITFLTRQVNFTMVNDTMSFDYFYFTIVSSFNYFLFKDNVNV